MKWKVLAAIVAGFVFGVLFNIAWGDYQIAWRIRANSQITKEEMRELYKRKAGPPSKARAGIEGTKEMPGSKGKP